MHLGTPQPRRFLVVPLFSIDSKVHTYSKVATSVRSSIISPIPYLSFISFIFWDQEKLGFETRDSLSIFAHMIQIVKPQ